MKTRVEIDHLVIACADLDQGDRWLHAHLGVAAQPGGRHETMGTHNRLLRLGRRAYLELMAVDPAAAPPLRPRWFGLDSPQVQARAAASPFMLTWAVRSTAAIDALAVVPQLGELLAFRRGAFAWRLTVPADGSLNNDGVLPAVIQWERGDAAVASAPPAGAPADEPTAAELHQAPPTAADTAAFAHPCDVLDDRGLELERLELRHPQADQLISAFRALKIMGPVDLHTGAPSLRAHLRRDGRSIVLT